MRAPCPHIILFVFYLFVTSCAKEVTQEELIDSAVKIKLDQWEKSQFDDCKARALLKAEEYVDSILVVMSLETKLDTIPKPEKPVKPGKPPFKEVPDSVIVKPIYKKD
jgi:hypothetical protein